MCWVAAIPIAIGLVGGLMQGQQQKAQAASQADALRQNALYLNNAADDAKVRGAIDADQYRVQTRNLIGTQRAAQAANGGLVNEGTNAIIQQDTAQLGELDALTIANNAAREAYGYQVEASGATTTASTLKSNARRGATTSLLGGFLSGASSAYGSGLFSSGGGASSLGSTSRLNNNQRYT